MAVLKILQLPDPNLRKVAEPIETIDDELRAQVDDMIETMYHAKGVGLAGTQVDIHKRIFTMDVSDAHDEVYVAINPEIIHQEGEQYESEGCLSVHGGGYDRVKRAGKVHMRAMNMEGEMYELEAEGLMAICIQHEVDHLNGILFVDHLSRLKQARIKKKLAKFNK